jgi:predicted acyl esterase
MRKTATLLAIALAASILPAVSVANASKPFEERLVKIPASMPDDDGNPIILDASVSVPTHGTPPYPAIILNHGFGGSRTSDGGTRHRLTDAGYIVLRWSQRGFGETGGEIDLMGEKERQDALDAVNWLNDPANVPEIWVDHIGQVGASYGASYAMAYATLNHPAIKAIAPLAGPSDFYAAMVPNDVPKLTIPAVTWALAVPTNKISEEFHRLILAMITGVGMPYAREQLRLRSEINRLDNIRTPLYLANGWNDSYFDAEQWLNIAPKLEANGVPFWIYLGGIGHPAAEPDTGSREALHIAFDRLVPFFDHFVKGEENGFEETPRIEVSNTHWSGSVWDGTTMTVDGLSFGDPVRRYLCVGVPTGTVQETPCEGAGAAALTNTWATAHPGGEYLARYFFDPYVEDATGQRIPEGRTPTPADTVTYLSEPLAEDLQLTGTPRFGVDVLAASVGAPDRGPGPVQTLQLDPIIWDLAPDGSRKMVTRGAYSENLDAPLGPHMAEFDIFGLSYRFPAGHRIQIEISTNDTPYLRPATNPFEVVIGQGSWIDLPGAENLSEPIDWN